MPKKKGAKNQQEYTLFDLLAQDQNQEYNLNQNNNASIKENNEKNNEKSGHLVHTGERTYTEPVSKLVDGDGGTGSDRKNINSLHKGDGESSSKTNLGEYNVPREISGIPASVRRNFERKYTVLDSTKKLVTENNFSLSLINIDEELGLKARFKKNLTAIKLINILDDEANFNKDFSNNEISVEKEFNSVKIISLDHKKILANYTGWGALHKVFDKNDDSWEKEREELKNNVSIDKYEILERTTLNAFYTTKPILDFVWKASEKLGFDGGNVFEPSAGTGKFFGYTPEKFKENTRLFANEYEHYSNAVTKYLYPKAITSNYDFSIYNTENEFDFIFQNPPFGKTKLYDANPKFKNLKNFSIHNYFIGKSAYFLKENGLMAVVVSNFFLDAKDNRNRKEIAKSLELISAFRLPNNVFQKYGTEVTTDLIFFKKNPDPTPERWLDVDVQYENLFDEESEEDYREETNKINNYYLNNPENLLGVWGKEGTMYSGDGYALVEDDINPLEQQLEKAFSILPEKVSTTIKNSSIEQENIENKLFVINTYINGIVIIPPKIGSYFIGTGYQSGESNFYTRVADPAFKNYRNKEESELFFSNKERKRTFFAKRVIISATKKTILEDLISIGTGLEKIIKLQTYENSDPVFLEKERINLNKEYHNFVNNWGRISKHKNLFYKDTIAPQVFALEDYDKITKKFKTADILITRTQFPYTIPTEAKNSKDALLISLDQKGFIDLAYMGFLVGKNKNEVLKELDKEIIEIPNIPNNFDLLEDYKTGDILEKIKIAKEYSKNEPRFLKNLEILEKALPPTITIENIHLQIGSHWIPNKTQKLFAEEIIGANIRIVYNNILTKWEVSGYASNEAEINFSTKERTTKNIYSSALNNTNIKIYDTVEVQGKEIRVLNADATVDANAKITQLQTAFKEWVWNNDEIGSNLEKIYNKLFNRIVPKVYDGDYLTLPTLNKKYTPRKHQKDAISMILNRKTTNIHHEVGAGKTMVAICSVMEAKRLGIVTKCMIVVPNHLIPQWKKEFLELYPQANILVPEKEDFIKENRRILFSKITNNDYDAIVIGESSLMKIPISIERQQEFFAIQMAEIEESLREYQRENEYFKIKDLLRVKEQQEQRHKKMLTSYTKDQNITFEELGINYLLIDEAHNFKNLPFQTNLQVKGLGNPAGSMKAMDLYTKIRILKELKSSKVVFLSGTPISNSISEMYNIQRYLDYEELYQNQGIKSFDNWVNVFAEISSEIEIKTTGVGNVDRLRSFKNLPELMNIYNNFSHIILNDEIIRNAKLNDEFFYLPAVIDKNIVLPASKQQQKINAEIIEFHEQGDKFKEANMLAIMTMAKKNSLDPRALNPSYEEDKISKVGITADMIITRYEKWHKFKGVQIVFLDFSVPLKSDEVSLKEYKIISESDDLSDEEMQEFKKKKIRYSFYEDLKNKLIDFGIKDDEISFIHDAKTDVQRKNLFEKVNNGDVRVLVGSTPKMGTGVNVQKRLIALYNIDCPWRPSDLNQRVGRIERHGNFLGMQDIPIEVIRIAKENTLDPMNWQIIEAKSKAFNEMLTQSRYTKNREISDIGEAEVLNAAQMKASATGNDDFIREIKIKTEIKEFESTLRNNKRAKTQAESKLIKFKETIKDDDRKDLQVDLDNYLKKSEEQGKNGFEITLFGKKIVDKKVANKIIYDYNEKETKLVATKTENINIGNYKGFKIDVLRQDSVFRQNLIFKLEGVKSHYCIMKSSENPILLLDNTLRKIKINISKSTQEIENAIKEIPICKNIIEKTVLDFGEIGLLEKELREVQENIKKYKYDKDAPIESKIDLNELKELMRDDRDISQLLIDENEILAKVIENKKPLARPENLLDINSNDDIIAINISEGKEIPFQYLYDLTNTNTNEEGKMRKNFEDIRQDFPFENYLLENGWQKDEEKSTPKWEVYKKDGETILLTDSNKGGYKIAYNESDKTMKDIIAFDFDKTKDWKKTFENLNSNNILSYSKKSTSTTPQKAIKDKVIFKADKFNSQTKDIEKISPHLKKYLTEERFIADEVLNHKRFSNIKVHTYVDYKTNKSTDSLLIPNYNKSKSNISSYEFLTEEGKKFHAEGGEKSLYITNLKKTDKTLVITESAIDLFSYYSLQKNDPLINNVAGVSTSGNYSIACKETFQKLINSDNLNIEHIVLAFDNDKKGIDLAIDFRKLCEESSKKLEVYDYQYPNGVKDLNDVLFNEKKPNFSVKIIDTLLTRESIINDKETLYIYSDDTRGEGNSVGIRTRKYSSTDSISFYSDKDFEENKQNIRKDINKALDLCKQKNIVNIKIFPLGKGCSKLEEKAPKTYKYLQNSIQKHFSTIPRIKQEEKKAMVL